MARSPQVVQGRTGPVDEKRVRRDPHARTGPRLQAELEVELGMSMLRRRVGDLARRRAEGLAKRRRVCDRSVTPIPPTCAKEY